MHRDQFCNDHKNLLFNTFLNSKKLKRKAKTIDKTISFGFHTILIKGSIAKQSLITTNTAET